MAGEGGNRQYWPTYMGVSVSNGNLHFAFGHSSCVTCGGGASPGVYPSPQDTKLSGPVLVYNTLGTADSDLGPKWMLPYHTYITTDGSGNATLIDVDGTERFFTKNPVAIPQSYTADKESAVLTSDGTDFSLTRCNGDVWVYGMSDGKLKTVTSRTGHQLSLTRDGNNRITKVTDGFGREVLYFYATYGSPSKTRIVEIREPAPGDVGWLSTFLDYDASGRLTSITNAIGETTRFEYDTSNRISKAYDGHGHVTEYTYDSSSRVTNIKDPDLKNTAIAYTSSTVRTVTNRMNKVTEYTIDSDGRITKVKDALNNEKEFTWHSTTWEMLTHLRPKIPVTGTPWTGRSSYSPTGARRPRSMSEESQRRRR